MLTRHSIRRGAAIFLAVLLAFTAFPVVSLAEDKIVYQSDFEKDTGGFAAMESNVEASAEQAHSGKSSLKISGGTEDWHGTRLAAAGAGIKLDGSYRFSAWVYTATEKQLVMQIMLTKAAGGTDYRWLASPTVKAGEWTEITATLDISSSEFTAIDNISFENKTAPYGDPFYVDDVTVVKTADLAPLTSEDSKSQMPVLDFEDGTVQGFIGRGGVETLQVSGDDAHSGSKSLKTTGREMDWHGPSIRVESYVAQGKQYEISAWVRAITPASSTFKLSTQIGEADGANYINLASMPISVNNGWVQLKGTYLYANTTSGHISIYIESDSPSAEYLVDDITLTEIEGGGIQADLTLQSLAELYKDQFLIGTAYSAQDTSGVRHDMLKLHFNSVTFENIMKPENTAPSAGNYTFAGADDLIEKATADGMAIAGHTLAWHQQSPAWLNKDASGNPLTRAEAEANLKDFFSNVAGHFKSKLLMWDVLNEAMDDNPANPSNWRASLRRSPWLLAFENGATGNQSGADYIDMMFREARRIDPNAILYYNDYNLDTQSKAEAVACMVKEINDAWLAEGNTRLLIEGIGMQGHYNTDTNMENVEASIKRFVELGVEISVTELDITVTGAAAEGLDEKYEMKQAASYARLFVVLKKYADSVARVTFWGMDDGTSWRGSQFPLLFNADLSPKQAYFAVVDPEGFLANYKDEMDSKRQGTAAYGTPVVDGVIDEMWSKSQKLPIDRMLQAWNTASGTVQVMWDESNLYVLFEITNAILDNSSAVVHEKDSVEAFFDEGNCKRKSYKKDDGQYRVCYDGMRTYGDSTDGAGFEGVPAVLDGSSNYIVEMKIPFKIEKPVAGMVIGFDAQVNDGEGGKRVGTSKWSDPTDNSWQDTSGWGEVTLLASTGDTAPAAPAVVEEPSPTPSDDVVTDAEESTTPWALIIVGISVVVVAVALFVMFKLGVFGKKANGAKPNDSKPNNGGKDK